MLADKHIELFRENQITTNAPTPQSMQMPKETVLHQTGSSRADQHNFQYILPHHHTDHKSYAHAVKGNKPIKIQKPMQTPAIVLTPKEKASSPLSIQTASKLNTEQR